MVRVDDGRDEIAAEGRANLEEEVPEDLPILLRIEIADLKIGAVGSQAGANGARHTGGEVAPHGGGAEEET